MRGVSSAILTAFLEAAERVESVLDSTVVAEHWEDQSALEGYTVAGLAGHLARAVLTAEQYVDAPAPPGTVEATDAAGYLIAVLGDHDPVDSDFHRRVRARSHDASAVGAAALAQDVGRARRRLQEHLDGSTMDRRVEVLQGVVLTVEEYLRTRLVELVVHLDDLAVSVGEENRQDLAQDACEEAAVVLIQVAMRRHGALAVIHGLARRERHPEAVRAF
ncbi:maleylpyruvate isomerase N-terminal domain-containing protein [Arthrobacter cheniae]|nr:maleylpyruvate isomerase N-terminal domain-containing protein [Arthrobacter cheniae]